MQVHRGNAIDWEQWSLIILCFLLVSTAWLRGGTQAWSQHHLPWTGLLLACTALASAARRRKGWGNSIRLLLTDPALLSGLAFIGLLLVQWWNAGRYPFLHPFTGQWTYTASKVPWLTSAVHKDEAAEMLRWFFPAGIIVATLRHALGSAARMLVLRVLTINGALLACFGLAQYLSGTNSVYWLQPLPCYFFASFGYPNHAGSYFLLMSGFAAALLVVELLNLGSKASSVRIILWTACLGLNLIGTNLSLSRAAMIFSLVLALIIACTLFTLLWQRLYPVQRINLLAGTAAVGILCFFVLDTAAGQAMTAEWQSSANPEQSAPAFLGAMMGDREFMHRAAVDIWRDYPWFGAGGWGFRYFLATKLTPDEWYKVGTGQANVHNDPLQFLAEFGSLGTALMLVVMASLAFPILRKKAWRQPQAIPLLAGLTMVMGHSLIDLPFRCPAILYAWLIGLAATTDPIITEHSSTIPGHLQKPARDRTRKRGMIKSYHQYPTTSA